MEKAGILSLEHAGALIFWALILSCGKYFCLAVITLQIGIPEISLDLVMLFERFM